MYRCAQCVSTPFCRHIMYHFCGSKLIRIVYTKKSLFFCAVSDVMQSTLNFPSSISPTVTGLQRLITPRNLLRRSTRTQRRRFHGFRKTIRPSLSKRPRILRKKVRLQKSSTQGSTESIVTHQEADLDEQIRALLASSRYLPDL